MMGISLEEAKQILNIERIDQEAITKVSTWEFTFYLQCKITCETVTKVNIINNHMQFNNLLHFFDSLSGIYAPCFVVLFCLMPDNFTHQGDSPGTH
jgi:hypothetical protein